MANNMTIRESHKRELMELINQQLAQDNPQLTPIVQDAARLALICRKSYYDMLFRAHVNGALPTGDQLAPPLQDETVREKVLKDFQSDRIWSFTINNNPLHKLEEQRRQFQQRINEMAAAQIGEPPRSELIWDRKTETDTIVNNIRDRVETFITELESPSPSLVRTAKAIDSESPMRKDGRISIMLTTPYTLEST